MKELSIKEKAKAYDELRKKIAIRFGSNVADEIFSEYEESEDERIRKGLINGFKQCIKDSPYPKNAQKYWHDIKIEDILAWLEKQAFNTYNANKEYWRGYRDGKQEILDKYAELEKQGEHQKFIDSIQIGDKVTRNEDGVLVNLSQLKRVAKKDEKQGEQKPTNKVEPKDYSSIDPHFFKPADKIEPKFHEGDWIIHHGTENIYQVVAVIDNQYQLKYGDNYTVQKCVDVDRCARLWNATKDAKDGDVISWDDSKCIALFKNIYDKDSFNSYGFVGHCTGTFEARHGYHDIEGAHPATKEQRDTLEKAMADAGYTFDFEKKELKKAEQTSANETPYPETLEKAIDLYYNSYGNGEGEFEHLSLEKFRDIVHTFVSDYGQKPAWSEEKLDSITAAINNLEYLKNNYVYHQMGLEPAIIFLKSLKDRYTWKPSDEQMEVLLGEANAWTKGCPKQKILESLYNDLKKLKG